jgi:hypothetical protein
LVTLIEFELVAGFDNETPSFILQQKINGHVASKFRVSNEASVTFYTYFDQVVPV